MSNKVKDFNSSSPWISVSFSHQKAINFYSVFRFDKLSVFSNSPLAMSKYSKDSSSSSPRISVKFFQSQISKAFRFFRFDKSSFSDVQHDTFSLSKDFKPPMPSTLVNFWHLRSFSSFSIPKFDTSGDLLRDSHHDMFKLVNNSNFPKP
jgi:hypothetical protein